MLKMRHSCITDSHTGGGTNNKPRYPHACHVTHAALPQHVCHRGTATFAFELAGNTNTVFRVCLIMCVLCLPRVRMCSLSACRKKVYDAYNDEEVQLTKEDMDVLRRIREGRTPHASMNPYEVKCTAWQACGWLLRSAARCGIVASIVSNLCYRSSHTSPVCKKPTMGAP